MLLSQPGLVALEAPHGAVLEFALLFMVILLGPLLVERAKVPGIIGLLLGGFAIGPHGLGWIGSGNQTIPELGQFGLLYLMFMAGLELDLNLLREYRKAAVSFGFLSFLLPMVAGTAVGFGQGWSVPAALLLGSLLASHTLIVYPMVRDAGRGSNPAVATAVGATVLTDTLALVVLAGVAGTESGSGSTAGVLAEVGIGLVVLGVFGFIVLPRLAEAALRMWGGDRAARYLVSVVSFLVMALIAEVFGIEGIVGAFFAGLALNSLVPNEGPSMERIEFFGSAVFIPVFLVSVGLLLDPAVMFTAETLGLGAMLVVACLGAKAAAAAAAKGLLGFSWPEAGAMFVLTAPQAAATLAATLVGFEIGLFGTTVVNAVLVLILVSIVVSTVLTKRIVERVPVPERTQGAAGERVLLAAPPAGPSREALRVAELLARTDGGMVEVLLTTVEGAPTLSAGELRALERDIFQGPLDGGVRVIVDRAPADAVVHAALGSGPTCLVIDEGASVEGEDWRPLAELTRGLPTVVVSGVLSDAPAVVVVDGPEGPAAGGVAALLARRIGPGRSRTPVVHRADMDSVPTGSVVVTSIRQWTELAARPRYEGSLLLVVMEPAPVDHPA